MVEVIRLPDSLIVRPWPACLTSKLYFERKTREGFPARTKVARIALYNVSTVNGVPVGLLFPGTFDRVAKCLQEARVPYTVTDNRPPLQEPVIQNLQALRDGQPEVLAAIATAHRGVIKGCVGFGKTFLVGQLARMYPTLKILVVTPQLALVKDLLKNVTEAVQDLGLSIGRCDGETKFDPRHSVVVVTVNSLVKIPADWPDILLFDEVHGAAAPGTSEVLAAFQRCRCYGLSGTPTGRSDMADRLCEALFGPQLADVTYTQAQAAGNVVPITVHFFPVECPEVIARNDHEREQLGYWQNDARNKLAVEKVAELFGPDDQVLYMVKTTEHAMFLRRWIPDVPVVHGGIDRERWLKLVQHGIVTLYNDTELAAAQVRHTAEKSRMHFCNYLEKLFLDGELRSSYYDAINGIDTDELRRQFRDGELTRCVCTTLWKQGVDFPQLRGLVPLLGTASSILAIQSGGRLSRLFEGKEGGVIVDFWDDYGATFLRRSKQRRTHYKKEGWTVIKHD